MTHARILFELVCMFALGGAAQWLAWRLRLPSILLLLLFGFAAGPTTGLLHPDAVFGELLLPLVSISVAIVLFEGGLTLNFRELRGVAHVVWMLVTLGALVSWVLVAAAAHWIMGLDWRLATLFGAILVVTGPTVIGPLLRHIRPTGPAGSILKWEGIVIDPIGALLAVLVYEVLFSSGGGHGAAFIAWALCKTIFVGGGLGLLAAALLAVAIRRYWLPEFLHNSIAIGLVTVAYAAANAAQHEAGLLAVTVMGIALANQRLADLTHILDFKENLRTLLISALFVLLAARISPADLRGLGLSSVVVIALLMILIRPASVAVSTLRSKLTWRERTFIGWMAPRGIVAAAVSSVFALRLEQAGVADGGVLVPLTFATIVATVLVYGLTSPIVAHRLKLADVKPQGLLIVGAHRAAREIALAVKALGFRVLLVDSNAGDVAAARLAGLPTYHGSILGERTIEQLDLGGIGQLLAMTPNEEVNILAVQRFAPIFGRHGVYQVVAREKNTQLEGIDPRLHGRRLFHEKATLAELMARLARGHVVKSTKLSEAFTFETFRAQRSPELLCLFVVSEGRRLTVVESGTKIAPKPGQTVVSLDVPPPTQNQTDKEVTNSEKPARSA